MYISKLFFSLQRGIYAYGSNSSVLGEGPLHRSCISGFSPGSCRRLRRRVRNSVSSYRAFATLTYPLSDAPNGRAAKRDFKAFVQRVKRHLEVERDADGISRAGDGERWSLLWFMEWTSRGVVHFHFFTTHRIDKDWLGPTWASCVSPAECPIELMAKVSTRIEGVRKGRQGLEAYAAKYASKIEQKKPPADWNWVGRLWGVWGDRETVEATITAEAHLLRDAEIRAWIDRANLEILDTLRCAEGFNELALPTNDVQVWTWRSPETVAEGVEDPYRIAAEKIMAEMARKLALVNPARTEWKFVHSKSLKIEDELDDMEERMAEKGNLDYCI